MTPEERFERIEANLDRMTERMDKFEVESETTKHLFDERCKQLLEMQGVLMNTQDKTFAAIDKLTTNIEKLIQGRGSNGSPS